MTAFHPKREDLPNEFGVFPLSGALLLPRGRLPLNIFEPRYLALVQDALGQGRMFGMIQPDQTPTNGDAPPALFRVGCLGRLSSFSETDDGRCLVTLTGVTRFAVVRELAMRHGYRRVLGDFRGFEGDLDLDERSIGIPREALIEPLRRFFARRGFEANWDAIESMPDDVLVITLCMICPFEPIEKQALLEAETEEDRTRTLVALLEMGAAASETPPGRTAS